MKLGTSKNQRSVVDIITFEEFEKPFHTHIVRVPPVILPLLVVVLMAQLLISSDCFRIKEFH